MSSPVQWPTAEGHGLDRVTSVRPGAGHGGARWRRKWRLWPLGLCGVLRDEEEPKEYSLTEGDGFNEP